MIWTSKKRRHNKSRHYALLEQKQQRRPMRIDSSKKVRTVAGENIVIMQSAGAADMTKVVALNASALDLYNALLGKDFGMADVVAARTDAYEVDPATAEADAKAWVEEMKRERLIVDE